MHPAPKSHWLSQSLKLTLSMFVQALSGQAWTNSLIEYRIAGYLFDYWKDNSFALHVEHFIALALKQTLIRREITDNQHCWHNSYDLVRRKVCQTKASVGKHTHTRTHSSVQDDCRQKLENLKGKQKLENKDSVAFETRWPRLSGWLCLQL